LSSKIDKSETVNEIKEISLSINKIITTIEKEPKKYKRMNNFFEYYLPTTLNIIKKYDEIENQSLTTQEGKKFMESSEKMISKINNSFKNQLSKLYQSDMIDTDAEIKVFNNMLNADGYNNENDLNINKGGE
jgi:5-bromo-4-chloroindolyl phosphate hydrolysis protein